MKVQRFLLAPSLLCSILLGSWTLSTAHILNKRVGTLNTKDRILEVALDLFNAEGVAALSAVDIASAMGISPGHLYYHFKGKPQILSALANAYQSEVDLILQVAREACRGEGATLETLWTHVHILAEEAWDARFLYREAGALVLRHTDLAALVRRIAIAEREGLKTMLLALNAGGVIAGSIEAIDGLSRLMTTGIAFHAIQLELEGDAGPPRDRVARAAAQIMLLPAGLARRQP